MSVVLFRRPARRPGPDMPEGELNLEEPPVLAEMTPDSSAIWQYLPMALMSVSFMFMYIRPGSMRGSEGSFMYLAMGLMVVASAGMMLGQFMKRAAERKQRLKGERRDYLRYLTQIRRRVRRNVAEQQAASAWHHPEPATLWSVVGTSRLWERRAADDDFAEVRVAVGDQKLGLKLVPGSSKPVEDLEPLCAHALRSFVRAYATVPDQPISVFLRAWSRVLFRGETARVQALVRSMLAELATFQSPEDLWIVVCAADDRKAAYDWLKWLPHTLHPHESDAAGSVRRIVSTFNEMDELLGPEFGERPPFDPDATPGWEEPYTVVVLDGVPAPGGHAFDGPGLRNTVVLDVDSSLTWRPGRTTLRLDLADGELGLVRTDRERKERTSPLGRADQFGVVGAGSLAKMLSPYRLRLDGENGAEPLSSDVELTTLLGIADLYRHDPHTLWSARTDSSRLRVPIALAADRTPVELDIKESAQGGTGPHGMLIGATGSGKSELLRTLVLSLALTNSSETLNFILVDFKGGATFLGLDALPHTSAVITNLADEAALVSRMQDALHGELMRRQELLRSAGNYTSALEYERARAGGAELAPLPSLFVVVDEFSELLSAHRDFMELFVMIGRLGRSLGVHLLLASQRLDEGRMHQLESHLSYRIGLRTFSAMESRGVLGVPDAYELPPQPGNGYMKTGVETLKRFRAAYVSGPHRRRSGTVSRARVASQVVPWSAEWIMPRAGVDPDPAPVPEPEPEEEAQSLLAVAVSRLVGAGPEAHQVWLPPLDKSATLDELLPGIAPHPELGLMAADYPHLGSLKVPVGIVDKPFDQRRDQLVVDMSGAGGHVAIAGGPQSGKSTFVRTIMTALALTHTPREVQFFCLDFGGGTLAGLARLPHVSGVASRMDEERVGRVISEVTALLADRERLFLDQEIDTMATYRRRRAAGELPDEKFGDVFLVIDGWQSVRQDYDRHLPAFSALASRGLNYGIHLIITTARWLELTSAIRDQAGTKLELRMGDAMDSTINARIAATVPRDPGRGITREGHHHFLTALPRIDGTTSAGDLSEGVAAMVATVRDHWSGPVAPPVRMLPTVLPSTDLPTPPNKLRIPIGLEQERLSTLWHDFSETPHMIVVGDNESGKTNMLRLIAHSIMRTHTPAEARIMVVDYRRQLVETIPDEYRLGHAVSMDALQELVSGAARAVATRVPGPDIAPSRMRLCDWWQGPRLFILVDDYDMVGAGPMHQPFAPLNDHLALGHEVGLHVVVARAAAGAGRGLSDALMRRLLEVNAPSLLLSCPPSEGFLFGNHKGRLMNPGRAMHISRRKTMQVQTALVDAEES
ncbi:type VII secretion protein EccCa [Streptomyces sp. NPDC058579]|uniref:type VII secretion protein EccCa n=1 Tax=Streptomyces sp. NPDC058579 TaxID=3346548 RepID=UPI00365AF49F